MHDIGLVDESQSSSQLENNVLFVNFRQFHVVDELVQIHFQQLEKQVKIFFVVGDVNLVKLDDVGVVLEE